MVPVGVREHERIDASHAAARERASERELVGAHINEHHPPAVAHKDGIALSHIEDSHLAALNRGGSKRHQDRSTQNRRQEPATGRSGFGKRPGHPEPHEQQRRAECESGTRVESHRSSRHERHPFGKLRRDSEHCCGKRPTQRAERRDHRSGYGANQADEHRHRHQRSHDRIRHRREKRHHPERRGHHRHRSELCDQCERECLAHWPPPAGHAPCGPLGQQAAEHQEAEHRQCRELKAEVEHRPRLQCHHGYHRYRK